MKKTNLIATVGLGILMASQASMAGQRGYSDTARVLQVTPIYETVQVSNPRQECWEAPVYHRGGGNSAVPMITGAIIGGAVGNQFGRGHGRDAMTVAGALLGGAIGNDIGRSNSGPGYETMERQCRTVDYYTTRQEVVGYRVKYSYNGHVSWTRTDTHPGRYIRVNVRPDNYYGHGMF